MAILDSLLVSLGYDFDDEDLQKFEASIGLVADKINNLALAAAGLATLFAGTTVASAGATDQLTKQARRMGIAVNELDAYNFAAEQAIGTSDGVADSLRQLSVNASEAARGTGSAVEAFGILGISVTDTQGNIKSVNQLFAESADALNSLSNESQRLELADKLGLGSLDLLLRQGSSGIAALTAEARELGTVTAEDGKAAEEFNDQVNRLQRVLTALVRFVSTSVLPVFTEMAKSIQEWSQSNREIVRSRIVQFLNALTFAMRNFQIILISILSLKFALFLFRMVAAYKALGAAALAANIKMFAIVLGVAAIIAVIGLLIEDFLVFRRGGESAIGALVERFPLLKMAIEKIGEALQTARAWATDFFELFFDKLDVARAHTTDFFESFFAFLVKARSFTTNVFESIANAFDKVKDIFNAVSGFFGEEVSATVNAVNNTLQNEPGLALAGANVAGSSLINAQPMFEQKAGGVNSTSNQVTNNNNNTITINGGDLSAVRRTVEDVVNGTIEQASNNAQSPVRS